MGDTWKYFLAQCPYHLLMSLTQYRKYFKLWSQYSCSAPTYWLLIFWNFYINLPDCWIHNVEVRQASLAWGVIRKMSGANCRMHNKYANWPTARIAQGYLQCFLNSESVKNHIALSKGFSKTITVSPRRRAGRWITFVATVRLPNATVGETLTSYDTRIRLKQQAMRRVAWGIKNRQRLQDIRISFRRKCLAHDACFWIVDTRAFRQHGKAVLYSPPLLATLLSPSDCANHGEVIMAVKLQLDNIIVCTELNKLTVSYF